MNTNGNIYTIVYTTVLVIVVAAILAFAATALKPAQEANVKAETIGQILSAAGYSTGELTNDELISLYSSKVTSAVLVDKAGNTVGTLATEGNVKILTTSDLKAQQDLMKKGDDFQIPVYIFGEVKVVPVYGAGLWGPIWGYIAFEADNQTLAGAIFDHKSETPGLGAKIAEEPFYSQFKGKKTDAQGTISVIKGGANGSINGVDAVSGGTITSKAVDTALRQWLGCYQPYFAK